MDRDREIYEKINQAVRLLCDVYDLLNKDNKVNETISEEDSYLDISDFVKKHNMFTQHQIRHYIYANVQDFANLCIAKTGRKIFIKEKAFFKWLNSKKN